MNPKAWLQHGGRVDRRCVVRHSRRARGLHLLVCAGLAACTYEFPGDVDVLEGTNLVITSGDAQTGVVGSALTAPLLVTTTDLDGEPIANLSIDFVVTAGGGEVDPPSIRTDIRGQAQTTLTLGHVPGANSVEVRTPGIELDPVQFSATALTGDAAAFTLVSGAGQMAVAGSMLPQPFVVRVADQFDNSVADASVAFVVTSGGGAVAEEAVQTNAQGEAATVLTLGTVVGANAVEAQLAGLNPVAFTATGVVGVASRLVLADGDNQSSAAGGGVPGPLVVRVEDANGNGVPAIAVAFAVTAGGGSVSVASAMTDSAGEASTSLTLGATAGTNLVEARATGLAGSPIEFTASGTNGSASQIVLVSGNAQTATVNATLTSPLVVRVTDVNANPISGFLVSFVVTGNNGSVTVASVASNVQGLAQTSHKLGTVAGENRVEARGAGLAARLFIATGTAGPPAKVIVMSGNNQTALAARQIPQPLTVRVQDAFNNALGNVSVSWVVTQGSALLTNSVTTTNIFGDSGILFSSLTMQDVRVEARVTGATSAAFFTDIRSFRPPVTVVPFGGTLTSQLAVADMNGDGKRDVLMTNPTNLNPTSGFGIALNTTAMNATTPSLGARVTFAGTRPTRGLAVADFNGDGKLDIATTIQDTASSAPCNPGCVSVLLNQTPVGGLAINLAPAVDVVVSGAHRVIAGDYNQDGKPDLAVVVANGPLSVLLNTTAMGATVASFAAPVGFPKPSPGAGEVGLEAADLNGDGTVDIVIDHGSGVAISFNTTPVGGTTPVFGPFKLVSISPQFEQGLSLVVGNFSSNGPRDLVTNSHGQSKLALLINTTTPGATTPSFQAPQTVADAGFRGDPDAADFNEDARADVVHPSTGVTVVLTTLGLSAANVFSLGAGVSGRAAAAADFNGDGRMDIVAADSAGKISILLSE